MNIPPRDYIFLSGNRFHPISLVMSEREGLIEKGGGGGETSTNLGIPHSMAL